MVADDKIQTDDKFVAGVRHQDAGDFETAEKLYCELLEQYPDNFELRQRLGYVLAQYGKLIDARQQLEEAVKLQPDNAMAWHNLGMVADLGGDQDKALASLRQALTVQPDLLQVHSAMADILLPYENYRKIIKRFHQWIRPSTYVEIGVESGASLMLAEPPTVCVGIDPEPKIQFEFTAPTQIISTTSDEFFKNNDLHKELGGRAIDMAFIDGLHHFEAALSDFINLERYASNDTVIMIHDCIPLDKATSTRDRVTKFWSGDTWKIIPVLKKYRPDLNIITIPAPPTGLAVITGLDPTSKVLGESLVDIAEEYMSMNFDALGQEKDEILNVVYDDWPSIQARIR